MATQPVAAAIPTVRQQRHSFPSNFSSLYATVLTTVPADIRDYLSVVVQLVTLIVVASMTLVLSPLLFALERLQAKFVRRPAYRHVLITGATQGIGEALAVRLAKYPGIRLTLIGRDRTKLRTVSNRCTEQGAEVFSESVDVSDRESMEKLIAGQDSIKPIDLVIANAGSDASTYDLPDITNASRHMFAVNVYGVLNTVLPLVPPMRARRSGQIVIMSSQWGFIPCASECDYAATKAAVRFYGEGLRALLMKDNIAVNVIAPGPVDTPLLPKVRSHTIVGPVVTSVEQSTSLILEACERNVVVCAFPALTTAVTMAIGALPPGIRALVLSVVGNSSSERTWRLGQPAKKVAVLSATSHDYRMKTTETVPGSKAMTPEAVRHTK